MRPLRTPVALALVLAPGLAAAQVDPAQVFYAVAFTHGSPHNGVITAQSASAPFAVVATGPRGTANGAITFDPGRSLLYAGSCCTADQALQAFNPVTLARAPTRDLTLPNSGSMAFEVDGPRRVLFFYDTVARTLRAVSLADANYGAVIASTTLGALAAEPSPTSVGDQLAVDTRGQRVIVTGGDGGPVLTVDVSGITAAVGTFGAVVNTGHVNRSTGNSGGAVAFDDVGRRIFFLPATGTVRVVGADPPFAAVTDIAISGMSTSDCGLSFDARTGNLYVGRGSTAEPVVVAFPSLRVTPFPTGPGEVIALSFAAPTPPCVDRDNDGSPSAACAAPGERADCDDARADVNPGAPELCDGRDNDCDGFTDEGFCRIDGACVAHDALNPGNACQRCDAPADRSAPTAWGNRPAATVCRPAGGACDTAEACDGTGAPCPADGFAASSAVCRPSASLEVCDPAERCTGASASCPSDSVVRAPTAETCNGLDDDCDGLVDEAPCVPPPDASLDAPADAVEAPADVPSDVPSDVPADVPSDVPADVPSDVPLDAARVDAVVLADAATSPDASAVRDAGATSDIADGAAGAVDGSVDGAATNDRGGASLDGGCGCSAPGTARGGRGWIAFALLALTRAARARRGRRTVSTARPS
jgi:hypothetical protein